MNFSLSLHNETFDIFGFNFMKDALFGGGVAVFSVVVFYYSWKIYPYFFSKRDMYRMSGFGVFLGRLVFAVFLSFVTWNALYGIFGLESTSSSMKVQSEPKSIITYPAAEFKNNQQPAQPSSNYKFESSREIAERNAAIATPKKTQYSEEEMNELEDKVQYHGTDPVVRSRLGLPPKE